MDTENMLLFHTGFQVIERPEVLEKEEQEFQEKFLKRIEAMQSSGQD